LAVTAAGYDSSGDPIEETCDQRGHGDVETVGGRDVTTRLLAGVAALAFLATACGGGDDTTDSGEADDVRAIKLAVRVVEVPEHGRIVGTARGMSLYVNDADTRERIRCTGSCAVTWHPVEVADEHVEAKVDGVNGTFGVVERPDGTLQLTLTGRPLYTYAKDSRGGVATGDGVTAKVGGTTLTWHVIRATGAMPTSTATRGGSPRPTDDRDDHDDRDDRDGD
jgi:predicted lipoprotein with Yx(FWY)xxD motif